MEHEAFHETWDSSLLASHYDTVREAMLPKWFGCHDQFGSPYHVRVDTLEIPKGVSGRGRP